MTDNIQLIDDLISNVQRLSIMREFKYYKEFFKTWRAKLVKNATNNVQFYASNDDTIQIFRYDGIMYNTPITFIFNVQYLIDTLNISLEKKDGLFPHINLDNDNGKLSYSTYPCTYTNYSNEEAVNFLSDIDKILIAPLPNFPGELVVLDGNHRICHQIYNHVPFISVYYVMDDIAVRALSSSFQACLYCFLFDVARIQANIGKISDGQLRNSLHIFNHRSPLFTVLNRKGIN